MKLVRYRGESAILPGLVDAQGQLRDLSGHLPDLAGDALDPDRLAALAQELNPAALEPLDPGRLLAPPVEGVGKLLCIGLNYADHAAETGLDAPAEPVLFLKATSAICGPSDDLVRPRGSTRLDHEVELAIVIGRKARHLSREDALSCVAGWMVANDVSERTFQLDRGGQWTKGKSCDHFAPLGPWLVTRDELPDPGNLDIWLEVDGERRQWSNTRQMIFSCAEIVSYLSGLMTLWPGDVILTGTPAGVAMGRDPSPWLQPGQNVRLGIAGLGEQNCFVRDED